MENYRIEIDLNIFSLSIPTQKPDLASDNYAKYQFNCSKKMLDA